MLRHIVLVTFKPGTTTEKRAAFRAAIEALPGAVPEVRSFTGGENVGSGPNHHDYAAVMDFDDMDAFRRYIASAPHQAYVANHGKVVVERLAAIQHPW